MRSGIGSPPRRLVTGARTLGVFALAFACSAVARAEAAPASDKIAVLPIVVRGELAPAWRERLQARVLEGVERGPLPVVPPADVLAKDKTAATCDDAPCRVAIGTSVGARWLVRPAVEVQGRDFRVDIELLDARDGRSVASSGETCEVCAVEEVAELLADHAAVLERKRVALEHAVPIVHLQSVPTGATIYVDDAAVGTAPLDRKLTPGSHRVRAELRGHLTLEQRVDVVSGADETVRFDLQRVPRRQILWATGWGLFGASLPVLGVGAALLVLDERPYRRRCTGEYVDDFGNCRLRYDTLAAGIATTSIAAAAMITATVLLVLGRPRSPRRTRAQLLPTGVAIVGRF